MLRQRRLCKGRAALPQGYLKLAPDTPRRVCELVTRAMSFVSVKAYRHRRRFQRVATNDTMTSRADTLNQIPPPRRRHNPVAQAKGRLPAHPQDSPARARARVDFVPCIR